LGQVLEVARGEGLLDQGGHWCDGEAVVCLEEARSAEYNYEYTSVSFVFVWLTWLRPIRLHS